MKIDEMIQNLLIEEEQNTINNEPPLWAKKILEELAEIKVLLKKRDYKNSYNDKRAYYSFVSDLRRKLKSDAQNNKYPRIFYNNKYYGISEDGLLYSMHTLNNLPTYKAFEIFEFLYKNKDNLDKYIFINRDKS